MLKPYSFEDGNDFYLSDLKSDMSSHSPLRVEASTAVRQSWFQRQVSRLVETKGETLNRLFQILEEWNLILQGASVDLSPSF